MQTFVWHIHDALAGKLRQCECKLDLYILMTLGSLLTYRMIIAIVEVVATTRLGPVASFRIPVIAFEVPEGGTYWSNFEACNVFFLAGDAATSQLPCAVRQCPVFCLRAWWCVPGILSRRYSSSRWKIQLSNHAALASGGDNNALIICINRPVSWNLAPWSEVGLSVSLEKKKKKTFLF